MSSITRPAFLPALEGMRGYAFLAVFIAHYTMFHASAITPGGRLLNLYILLSRIAVPMFFVLSGYLITMVTYQTRDRAGFFRVYYWRRALRVLPAYYAGLGIALVLALALGASLNWKHLLLPLFLHNFSSTSMGLELHRPAVMLDHLWSMAVEEQFYLLWPIALWFVRRRVPLLVLCYAGIVAVNLVRLGWPIHPFNPTMAYFMTVTRADGILMGCALALHRLEGRPSPWSRYAAYGLLATAVAFIFVFRADLNDMTSQLAVSLLYPLLNCAGLGLILLALEDGWTKRVCSTRVATYLGRRSYGLYVFHMLYLVWFERFVVARFGRVMPEPAAVLLGLLLALGLTLVLAGASYRWLEAPVMRQRDRFAYGPPRPVAAEVERAEMPESALAALLRLAPRAANTISLGHAHGD